jgi:hypothetical protein
MPDMQRHDNRNASSAAYTEITAAPTSIVLIHDVPFEVDRCPETRLPAGFASAIIIRRNWLAAGYHVTTGLDFAESE